MEEKIVDHVPAARSARPLGVMVFGFLLILSSLVHMHTLIVARGEYYSAVFGYWPHWLMTLRYFFSWAQRIAGLMAGVGILYLKDIFRKLAILIGCFSVVTIYWKHPYQAFKNHAVYLDQHLGVYLRNFGYPNVTFAQYTLAALIVQYLLDFIFFGSMIYYLTRPAVKARFK